MIHLKALVMTVLLSTIGLLAFFWFLGEQNIFLTRPVAIVIGSIIGLTATLIVVTSILKTALIEVTKVNVFLTSLILKHDLMEKPNDPSNKDS